MATPSENLATSLVILKALQDQGIVAIRSAQLSRMHRERLLKNGFIQEIVRGWYIPTRPDEVPGESTAWYSSFWSFCAEYLNDRFGEEWCLSPEQSLALFAGDWTVPKQVVVRALKGGNKPLQLPFNTSIFDVRLNLPPPSDIQRNNGLRVYSLAAGLIAATPTHYSTQPIVMRAALATLTDASEVLGRLLEGGHSTVAGRLVGALRNIGRTTIADHIVETMRAANYTINETDPFKDLPRVRLNARETSPYVNRMTMMWQAMREDVLAHFPLPSKTPIDPTSYLQQVDDVYVTDAYNSLSIEGYKVTPELIERVRSGSWNPDTIEADRNHRDALAARGYWQAFQRVKMSVARVLQNEMSTAI